MAHPQTQDSGNEEDSSYPVTILDFSILEEVGSSPETTRDSSKQTPEDNVRVLQQPPATSETSKESRKRKISNLQNIICGSDTGKQPRNEICGTTDRFDSSLSEKGCSNPHLKNLVLMPSHNAVENSLFIDINPEISNSEESYPQNELNVPRYLECKDNFNTEQNIASKKNISQKEKASSENSDANVSKIVNEYSVDDILAVSSSSRCQENNYNSNISLEKLHNVSPAKQQPRSQVEKKQATCVVCGKTISEHEDRHDEKNNYRCCRCPIISENFNYLQIHIYSEHFKFFYCEVCKLKYSEEKSHARVQKCDECQQKFECKYQLEEHYILHHKEFLETICLLCKRKYIEHTLLPERIKTFMCCVSECTFSAKEKFKIDEHVRKHCLLKLFKCEICGKHFKTIFQTRNHLTKIHPLCKLCGKRFVNSYFLAEHCCEKHRKE